MSNMICITGMHRSGTSLVASWLEGCGLKLYDKVGAHVGNPFGHYEDESILKVHMAAMRRIWKNSKGWIADRKSKIEFSDTERKQIIDIVDQRNELAEVWGWKDPRASLFLNEWKEIIPEMKTILLWRNCNQVVDSLKRRAKKAKREQVFQIKTSEAFKNWKYYNSEIYKYYKNNSFNTILVNIDFLLQDSFKTIHEINKKFNIGLEEKDIGNYYRKEMFTSNNELSLKEKLFYKVYHINSLEHKLKDASFSS